MTSIHWLPAITGGLLIGSAALLLYAGMGRIAGISGITYTTLFETADRYWRLLFLGGLVLGAWLALPLAADAGVVLSTPPAFALPVLALFIGAGLLTGYGTRMGGGCTSGHGVCGVARFSPRSIVATVLFMGAGMAAATLLRPLLIG